MTVDFYGSLQVSVQSSRSEELRRQVLVEHRRTQVQALFAYINLLQQRLRRDMLSEEMRLHWYVGTALVGVTAPLAPVLTTMPSTIRIVPVTLAPLLISLSAISKASSPVFG